MPKETYQPALLSFEKKAHRGVVSQSFEVPREFALAPVMYSIRNRSATVEWLEK